MFAFLRLIFGHRPPSLKRMMACEDACAGLEARIEQHYAELKSLRGLVNSTIRKEKAAQDAPGETNGDSEASESTPPPKRFAPTAELARRFRSF